jgi:hypothetical protein
MKRVLLLLVSIRTIDAGACYNETANAALLRQGAALQCAGAATKMPCLDLQRPTLPPRLFHLHLSKMNGRSVLDRAPGVTGLPRCPWTRSSGGTSTFRRGDQGRKRVIQPRFNVSVPRARVSETGPTLRDRSER